jgi:hypothetical protein
MGPNSDLGVLDQPQEVTNGKEGKNYARDT